MIVVTLQYHKPPTYLDKIEYSNSGESLVTQELMDELPILFRSTLPDKNPNNILRRASSHLLGKHVGPWKVVLLTDERVLFTLEFGLPQLEIDLKEVSRIPRVSRYAREPVI